MRRLTCRRVLRGLKRALGIPPSDLDTTAVVLDRIRLTLPDARLSRGDGYVRVSLSDKLSAICRPLPHSDLAVLEQIFIARAYRALTDYFPCNRVSVPRPTIIDAGANIGLAALYLLRAMPNAHVACVEPDAANVQILRQNLRSFVDTAAVTIFPNAVMGVDGQPLVTERTFRDGRDWSVTVVPSRKEDATVVSVTIDRLMSVLGWNQLDILKIDIEGAERFVFSEEASLQFLPRTRLIMVELHDEFGCRDSITELLRKGGYVIVEAGEGILALNRRNL